MAEIERSDTCFLIREAIDEPLVFGIHFPLEDAGIHFGPTVSHKIERASWLRDQGRSREASLIRADGVMDQETDYWIHYPIARPSSTYRGVEGPQTTV